MSTHKAVIQTISIFWGFPILRGFSLKLTKTTITYKLKTIHYFEHFGKKREIFARSDGSRELYPPTR